jgi:hypothetical protein
MRAILSIFILVLALTNTLGCAFNQIHEEKGHMDYDQKDDLDRVR